MWINFRRQASGFNLPASLRCSRLGGKDVSAPALVLDFWVWISFHRLLKVETSGFCVGGHLVDEKEGGFEVHGMIVKIRHVDYVFSQMEGEQKRTFSLQHAAHFRKSRDHVFAADVNDGIERSDAA